MLLSQSHHLARMVCFIFDGLCFDIDFWTIVYCVDIGFMDLYPTGLYQVRVKNLFGKTRLIEMKHSETIASLKSKIEEGSKKEKEFLEHHITSPFPTTSILTAVSELLPDSIWLVELKVSREAKENTFLLKGLSLPSPHYSSIQDIEKYLREIKERFPPATQLILTTSRQVKENQELTLFTAIFKWP